MSVLVSGGKVYTLAPDPGYPDTGGVEQTDGLLGTSSYSSANWCGWAWLSPTARIDLGAVYTLSHVRFHFLIDEGNGVYAPNQLIVSGSNNDVDYTALGTFTKTTDWVNGGPTAIHWSNDLAVAGSYRYIKFVFTYQTWWIFLSELEIYWAPVFVPRTSGLF